MAIDTSIALGVKTPQFQTIDPMTVYNAMQEQQYNALRSRLVEQQMAQNALAMQNTMEDRRAAAAKAALKRRQQEELLRTFRGGYQPAKNPVMGPGTIQGATPAGFDYEGVKNKLIGAGNVGAFKTVSELQEQEANRLKAQRAAENESATGAKTQAETKGLDLKNIDTRLATIKSLTPMVDTKEGAAAFSKLVTQIVPEFASIAGDPDEAAARNAEAFLKDPEAWRTQVSNLTAEQLVQAKERAKEASQPKVTVLPPGSVATDLNPNSPTYGQPIAKGEPAKKTEIEAKAEIKEEARKGTDATLDRLFNAYTKLNEMGALPSETKSWLGNIPAKVTTSVIGQTANIAPKAQTQIQTIKGLRQDLIRDIKNATGMSAQEMNSNVELQSLLDAATDPNQNIESVLPRLADFSQRYGTGKLASGAPERAAASAETKSTFASEAEADAYFTQRGAKSGDKFKVTIGGQSGTYVVP